MSIECWRRKPFKIWSCFVRACCSPISDLNLQWWLISFITMRQSSEAGQRYPGPAREQLVELPWPLLGWGQELRTWESGSGEETVGLRSQCGTSYPTFTLNVYLLYTQRVPHQRLQNTKNLSSWMFRCACEIGLFPPFDILFFNQNIACVCFGLCCELWKHHILELYLTDQTEGEPIPRREDSWLGQS